MDTDLQGKRLAKVLGALIVDESFEKPLHVVMVGANGSIMASRWDWSGTGQDLKPTATASHIEGPGLAAPINIMVVDSEGDAARFVMDEPDSEIERVD